MIDHLQFYGLLVLGLLCLGMTFSWLWLRRQAATDLAHRQPIERSTRCSTDPKPFPGLTAKPTCVPCEQAQVHATPPPGILPPLIVATRGRPRQVATQQHYCPKETCVYDGWMGRGNIRTNGHPDGGPWRQFQCLGCQGYFQETHGTPLHGTRVAAERLVGAVASLAEGLGIRAVARVFEVDPNTVLRWLAAVADHAAAFSQYFLHDMRVSQVQVVYL